MSGVVAPSEVAGAWPVDPLTALLLLAAGSAYVRGVERLRRRPGGRRAVAGWQVTCYLVGVLLVAVALLSPLEALSGTLLTAHMAQHLLLTLAAAPLLALGAPGLPVSWGLPARLRRPLHRLRPPRRWRARLSAPWIPVAAALVHVAVLWAWHVPPVYTAAVRSTPVHVLEHGMMLGSALWLWSTLVSRGGPVRRATPVAALATFLVATLSVGLGALLTFAPFPAYDVYEPGARAWGTTALADQQQAGAMMWSIGGIVYMAAGAVVFGVWLAAAHAAPAADVRGSGQEGKPPVHPASHTQ